MKHATNELNIETMVSELEERFRNSSHNGWAFLDHFEEELAKLGKFHEHFELQRILEEKEIIVACKGCGEFYHPRGLLGGHFACQFRNQVFAQQDLELAL